MFPSAHSPTIHTGGGGERVCVLPFTGVTPLEETRHLVVMFMVAYLQSSHVFVYKVGLLCGGCESGKV